MDFLRKDYLTEQEREILFRWSPDPFGSSGFRISWRPVDHHLVVIDDGRPVSHVGMLQTEIHVGDKKITVAGFGNVITVPAFQGRGIARAALGEAVRIVADEWQLIHCLVFCGPLRKTFYEMLGWMELREPVWASQPDGQTPASSPQHDALIERVRMAYGPVDLEGRPW